MINSYFTLRRLTESTERDLDKTFQRMIELLEDSEESARIQFQIIRDTQPLCWCLELERRSCRVTREKIEHADFEIITKAKTWWQIAEGSLAPLRAFTQGKMRVRGNIELGQRVLKQLASSKDSSDEWRK